MSPNVFEYEDYRKFLRDFYEEGKKLRRGMSYRSFSLRAGLKSPAHLKLVMSGRRNLSLKTLPKFVKGLKLDSTEARYFGALVNFNQATDSSEKARFWYDLEKFRARHLIRTLDAGKQSSLFSQWYYPILYALAQLPSFTEESAVLAKKIGFGLTTSDIERGFKVMERAGLLVRDPSGRLKAADLTIRTEDDRENLLVREYHRRMIECAQRHLNDPLHRREYGFITIPSTPEAFQNLKNAIKEFLLSANTTLTTKDAPQAVYQLNIQLFELMK